MTKLEDHPGFLGGTSQGVIAIHADWPAYAVEHGVAYSLGTLGQFPRGIRFYQIDDIDQCILFRAGEAVQGKDNFDERHLHVALWHKDVLELHELSLVAGATGITPQEWAVRRAEELKKLFRLHPDGRMTKVRPPSADDWEDQERTIAMISSEGLVVTESGHQRLQALMADGRSEIAPEINARAEPMLQARLYDSAVRDACLLVEHEIRQITRTELFGSQLVERLFSNLLKTGRYVSARLKTFRTEVRTTFKFVRNDVMHNFRDISESQCIAILVRVSSVLRVLQHIRKCEAEQP